jgi:hypothetical protein
VRAEKEPEAGVRDEQRQEAKKARPRLKANAISSPVPSVK